MLEKTLLRSGRTTSIPLVAKWVQLVVGNLATERRGRCSRSRQSPHFRFTSFRLSPLIAIAVQTEAVRTLARPKPSVLELLGPEICATFSRCWR